MIIERGLSCRSETDVISANITSHFSDLIGRRGRQFTALVDGNGQFQYTYKARGAIQQLLESVPAANGGCVLIPAFHCPTVVQPVLRAGYRVRFYAINENLSIDHEDLQSQLDEDTAAVIIIHYFGFHAELKNIADVCHESNALLIEDWSHSFLRLDPLRLAGDCGDVAIYSLWKLIPSGVGGAIRQLRFGTQLTEPHENAPLLAKVKLFLGLLENSVNNLPDGILKSVFLGLERVRLTLKRVRSPSAEVPATPQESASCENAMDDSYPEIDIFFRSRIPAFSRRIIERSDLRSMIRRRRENYRAYLEMLPDCAEIVVLHPELDEGTCPFGFPVLMEGRRGKDQRLRQLGVPFLTFGEILHPSLNIDNAAAAATKTANDLSDRIIFFAVHQDIVEEDIEEYCRLIVQVASS